MTAYFAGDIPSGTHVITPLIDLEPYTSAVVYIGGLPVAATIEDDDVLVKLPPLMVAGVYAVSVVLSGPETRQTVAAEPVIVEAVTGWHSLASARREWIDAPSNDEQLYELLEIAKAQVVAYKPLPLATSANVPGGFSPDIIATDNGDGTATFANDARSNAGQDYVLDNGDGTLSFVEAPTPGLPPVTFAVAVDSVVDANGEVEFIPTPGTEPAPFEFVPTNFKLAQLVQSRNVWTATKADSNSGGFADGDYMPAPARPLDWHVQQLLRPKTGAPRIG
jgi:hypothetical protein